MASQRPTGPQTNGRTPKNEKRIYLHFDRLVSLVPRDLAEKLMSKVSDSTDKEIEADDDVLLDKSTYEAIKKEMENNGTLKTYITQFEKWAKKVVGKRMKDLPTGLLKLPKKEKLKYLKEDTDEFVKLLVSGWTQTIWLSSRDKQLQIVRLNDFLLPTNPDKDFFNKFGRGANSWLDVVFSNANQVITEKEENDAIDVYKAFIANLKTEIDRCSANQKEIVIFDDIRNETLMIGHDAQGYFLKKVDKPQTQ